MKWIAAKVTFDGPDRELATDLVADIFYTLDLKGVVVDDPVMDLDQDWGDDAVRPPTAPGVTGYFADTRDASEKCRYLETALGQLQTRTHPRSGDLQPNRRSGLGRGWKEYFWPERISERIVVKPTWRDYAAQPEEIIIEIDPGMAFGTGTHATTALSINLIETYLKPGDHFLDVGTGSGILMIAAAKLGADHVFGVDSDSVAVTVAEKNLGVNKIADFRLLAGNLVDEVRETFDVVAANILAEVILVLLPAVARVLKEGGTFICSGIITAKKEVVREGLTAHGFNVVELLEKDGWVAIACRKATAANNR